MEVNKNENCHYYDVDDTLVMWNEIPGVASILVGTGNYKEVVWPNYKVINSVKQAKARGHHVTVHSQGGYEWALAVVDALGLAPYVDVVKTKAKWYHDDIDANEWMTRIDQRP